MGANDRPAIIDEAIQTAADPELNALLDSLPRQLQCVLDRMLYELPLSNTDDNWLLRMAELKGLDTGQVIARIEAWRQEMDARRH